MLERKKLGQEDQLGDHCGLKSGKSPRFGVRQTSVSHPCPTTSLSSRLFIKHL